MAGLFTSLRDGGFGCLRMDFCPSGTPPSYSSLQPYYFFLSSPPDSSAAINLQIVSPQPLRKASTTPRRDLATSKFSAGRNSQLLPVVVNELFTTLKIGP